MTDSQTDTHTGGRPGSTAGSTAGADADTATVDAARLAARWAELEAEREHIETMQRDIKDMLAAQLGDGKHTAGALRIRIWHPRKFDAALARDVLTADALNAICTLQIDTRRAREVLPPDVLAECERESAIAYVSIR